VPPRVITVDKNAAYPKAFKELKEEGAIPNRCELRQVKDLNNIVEQDHRFIKRLWWLLCTSVLKMSDFALHLAARRSQRSRVQ
jgi:transposase-like protein